MHRFLRLLCPGEFVESVTDINVSELKSSGIHALLVDLDNTLVPWQGYNVPSEIISWIKDVNDQGIKICLVSNTFTTGRLNKLSSMLNVEFAVHAQKPRRAGFREALELLKVEAHESVVIGDQIFTDILGGNRLGIHTILVSPMHKREFFGTKISRFFERILLRSFEQKGLIRIIDNKS
ncbi:MAG: YqeG family HAD IIIA-type phosphatase [Armatimonadota bacterium]